MRKESRLLSRRFRSGAQALGCLALAVLGAPRAGHAFDYASYRPYEVRVDLPGAPVATSVQDDTAVIADDTGHILLYDIADPVQPVLLDQFRAWWPEEENLARVRFSQNYVMVASNNRYNTDSITSVLRREGSTLRLCSSGMLREPGGHYFSGAGLAVSDGFVFVSGYRSPIAYPNIFVSRETTDPYRPLAGVAIALGPNQPWDTVAVGNRLFVSSSLGGLKWLEFAVTGELVGEGVLDAGRACVALAAEGGLVCGADARGNLVVLDGVSAGAPAVLAELALGGSCADLALRGDELLWADPRLGIRRLDLSDRAHPVETDTFMTGSGARVVGFSPPYLAAASPSGGLLMIDPTRPHEVPVRASVPAITGGFAAHGAIACGLGIIDGQRSLVLARFGDTGGPRVVDSIPYEWGDGGDIAVAMSDSKVAVGVVNQFGEYDLSVVDFDGVSGFAEAGLIALRSVHGREIAVWGTSLYVVERFDLPVSRLTVWDVRDPWQPLQRQVLSLDGYIRAISRDSDTVWCAGWRGEASVVHAIEMAQDGTLTVRASAKVPGRAEAIVARDDLVAVTDLTYGHERLLLLDAAKPADLRVLSELPMVAQACALVDSIAYVSSSTDLGAWSIADPRRPRLIGTIAGPDKSLALTPAGLLSGGQSGLLLFAPQGTEGGAAGVPSSGRAARLHLEPNPFNPRVRIRLAAGDGPAVCEIFDLQGRRIRRLETFEVGDGELVASWDGCDSSGRAVASGSYMVRALTAHGTSCGKAVLVR